MFSNVKLTYTTLLTVKLRVILQQHAKVLIRVTGYLQLETTACINFYTIMVIVVMF